MEVRDTDNYKLRPRWTILTTATVYSWLLPFEDMWIPFVVFPVVHWFFCGPKPQEAKV